MAPVHACHLHAGTHLRDGLVDIVDRAVLQVAVVAVDAPDQLVHLRPQISVFGDLRSRRHAHLKRGRGGGTRKTKGHKPESTPIRWVKIKIHGAALSTPNPAHRSSRAFYQDGLHTLDGPQTKTTGQPQPKRLLLQARTTSARESIKTDPAPPTCISVTLPRHSGYRFRNSSSPRSCTRGQ